MRIDDMYPSKYLKASDVENSPTYTIKAVEMEAMKTLEGKDESKPVVFFKESPKGVVLNKTNAKIITALYGPDTDGWIDQRVTLIVAQVDAFGEMQPAIRISTKKPVIDKTTLMNNYLTLWERGKRASLKDIDDYVIASTMSEQEITALGKELKLKIEAAEAFA